MGAYRVVFVTAPNLRSGARVAEALVSERLAACVNLLPARRSIYRWKGKTFRHPEVLLIAKTRASCFPRLLRRVKQLHPYTVPEVIELPILRGNPAYLSWVRSSTR